MPDDIWSITANRGNPICYVLRASSTPQIASKNYGGEAVENSKIYGGDAVENSKICGGEAVENSKIYGGDAVENSKNYGGEAVENSKIYGGDAVENCIPSASRPEYFNLLRPTDSANSVKSYGFASGFPRTFSYETRKFAEYCLRVGRSKLFYIGSRDAYIGEGSISASFTRVSGFIGVFYVGETFRLVFFRF
jgi:hypothetical protein